MPPDRILRLPAVIELTGLGRSAIYQAIARGRFPRPVPLAPGNRARGWLASEIAAHQQRCVAERDAPPRSAKQRRPEARR
jgi:prophage regulatory protein